MSRDAAEYLLSLRFEDSDISRMDEWSELARQGSLSVEDTAGLDSYIHAGHLLALTQSKARLSPRALES
ncbi:MAG TPA: hypothetical protein VG273_28540 [Bryobacteraceae bacterium]|nr:hypothetical protein [Bryobacteraceae bacterium]